MRCAPRRTGLLLAALAAGAATRAAAQVTREVGQAQRDAAAAEQACLRGSPDFLLAQRELAMAERTVNGQRLASAEQRLRMAVSRCEAEARIGADGAPVDGHPLERRAACVARQPGYLTLQRMLEEARGAGDERRHGALREQLDAIAARCDGGAAAPAAPAEPPLVEMTTGWTLSVRDGERWTLFWRADAAPARYTAADAALTRRLAWREVGDGIAWAELALSGRGEAVRTRLVVVRLDPARVRFGLDFRPGDLTGTWTLDAMPADAALALNAGQFTADVPWGWLVLDGRERKVPGSGPLAGAFVVGTDGRAEVLGPAAVKARRKRGGVALAFQSYPMLLTGDGEVPPALFTGRGGLRLEHRDARLAVGETHDGQLLIAMTRFDGLGGALDRLPLGLTVTELSAVMGALGCRTALGLDGGISAQLALREGTDVRQWPGTRAVPLGLVVRAGGAGEADGRAGGRGE
ncbi:MAG: phosphodiester glycosidase family protein [Gemmatimonadales bacterium]|nr:phosphodiester glycosidase family protein [Gemmatimonadales bacterium]